jgi:peptidoglycan/LPS O-acetylase OafA/YrhL
MPTTPAIGGGMSTNLDLLRSVAVLCVFFAHLNNIFTGARGELSWHFGQMGVLIFFVHTSLVLMRSIERQASTERRLLESFYLRRFFRIFPLSIFCVLTAYFFSIAPDVDLLWRHWTLRELASNLTLTQNLTYSDSMVGGLWTLPLEVQMYVVLPFLFLWFRARPIPWLFALWVLTIPIAIFQPHVSGRASVLEYVPCFLGGVIAWRISGRQRFSGLVWPIALVATTFIWMLADRAHNMYFRWAFCLALGLVIPWFRDLPRGWLTASAETVAKYSYGIYLSHAAVLLVAFRMLAHRSAALQWLVFVILAPLVPFLMYHLIEHPMIQFGKAVAERICEPTTVVLSLSNAEAKGSEKT